MQYKMYDTKLKGKMASIKSSVEYWGDNWGYIAGTDGNGRYYITGGGIASNHAPPLFNRRDFTIKRGIKRGR